MSRVPVLAAIATAAVLLAACGHDPAPRSETVENAIEWNRRAERAFRAGDPATARDYYVHALELYRSIEHSEGVATEIVNIATVELALGETDAAKTSLDALLGNPGLGIAPAQRAEAAYRRAWIALREGSLRGTDDWLARAEEDCRSECAAQGRLLNLRAQLALATGNARAAAVHADAAAAYHRRVRDPVEEANALYLLGDARAALGELTGAIESYRAALELDKNAGVPRKIARDLMRIGRTFARQGDARHAVEHLRRALTVYESIGDAAGAQEARRALAPLGTDAGR
jgi:tetratricopeptide (TPR) repeat protein